MTKIADLEAGTQIHFDQLTRPVTLTVLSVERTGSVKFGQVGPDATPIMRVTVDGMPKPLAGVFYAAADQEVELA